MSSTSSGRLARCLLPVFLLIQPWAWSQSDESVLFDGSGLDAWEAVGDGLWSITPEGELLGIHDLRKPLPEIPWFNSLKSKLNRSWFRTGFRVQMNQAWLYTRQEFSNFALHLEWWVPTPGNSGVSIGDRTRAKHTFGAESDLNRTPSQIAYEIQIASDYPDTYGSGSIYSILPAKTGFQHQGGWNNFDLEVRDASIRVSLNGTLVAEQEALPGRSTAGPIGLQLHDEASLAMFRSIRVRPLEPPGSGEERSQSDAAH